MSFDTDSRICSCFISSSTILVNSLQIAIDFHINLFPFLQSKVQNEVKWGHEVKNIPTCGRGILSSEKLARLKLSPCVRFSSIGGVLLFVVLSKCAFLACGIFRFNVPPEEIFSTRFSLLNEGADELLLWHVLSVVWNDHFQSFSDVSRGQIVWSTVLCGPKCRINTNLFNFSLIFITWWISCPS